MTARSERQAQAGDSLPRSAVGSSTDTDHNRIAGMRLSADQAQDLAETPHDEDLGIGLAERVQEARNRVSACQAKNSVLGRSAFRPGRLIGSALLARW